MLVGVGHGCERTISGLLSTRLVTATTAVVSAVVAIHVLGSCAVMSRLKTHANQKFEVQLLQMEHEVTPGTSSELQPTLLFTCQCQYLHHRTQNRIWNRRIFVDSPEVHVQQHNHTKEEEESLPTWQQSHPPPRLSSRGRRPSTTHCPLSGRWKANYALKYRTIRPSFDHWLERATATY